MNQRALQRAQTIEDSMRKRVEALTADPQPGHELSTEAAVQLVTSAFLIAELRELELLLDEALPNAGRGT